MIDPHKLPTAAPAVRVVGCDPQPPLRRRLAGVEQLARERADSGR